MFYFYGMKLSDLKISDETVYEAYLDIFFNHIYDLHKHHLI